MRAANQQTAAGDQRSTKAFSITKWPREAWLPSAKPCARNIARRSSSMLGLPQSITRSVSISSGDLIERFKPTHDLDATSEPLEQYNCGLRKRAEQTNCSPAPGLGSMIVLRECDDLHARSPRPPMHRRVLEMMSETPVLSADG